MIYHPKKVLRPIVVIATVLLLAVACGDDESDSEPSPPQSEAVENVDETRVPDEPTTTQAPDEPQPVEDLKIGFFGYANVNGFTQGIWQGVQTGAVKAGAEAVLFDGQFDGTVQAEQIQNAITAGDYDAFIITANNGAAITPAVEEAIAEGIAVVGVYSAIGPDFLTLDPQIDGLLFAGTKIAVNGTGMGEMAIDACADRDPCFVSYLIGFPNFPLDDARTAAFETAVSAAPNVVLVDNAVGGYDQGTGQQAADAVFLANDQIDVMVGSSQAILGAEQSAISNGVDGVQFIGNGSPTQAVSAVKEGRWYGVWVDVVGDAGEIAVDLAVEQLSGGSPAVSTDLDELAPILKGTADSLGDFEGQWTN